MPNIANPFHNYVIHATFLNQVKAIKLALKLPKAQYLAPTQTTQVLYLSFRLTSVPVLDLLASTRDHLPFTFYVFPHTPIGPKASQCFLPQHKSIIVTYVFRNTLQLFFSKAVISTTISPIFQSHTK